MKKIPAILEHLMCYYLTLSQELEVPNLVLHSPSLTATLQINPLRQPYALAFGLCKIKSLTVVYKLGKNYGSVYSMNEAFECHDLLEIKKGVQYWSGQRIFLAMTPKAQATKAEIYKCHCIRLKIFCTVKERINRLKSQSTEWEKIFANHLSDRG